MKKEMLLTEVIFSVALNPLWCWRIGGRGMAPWPSPGSALETITGIGSWLEDIIQEAKEMSPPKFLDLDQTHTSLHKLSVMDETEKNELSKTDYSIYIGNMHIETQELAFLGLSSTKKWPKNSSK